MSNIWRLTFGKEFFREKRNRECYEEVEYHDENSKGESLSSITSLLNNQFYVGNA